MTTKTPATPLSHALLRARLLVAISGVLLLLGLAAVGFALGTGVTSLLLGLGVASALLVIQILFLTRAAVDPERLVLWVGGGYVVKILTVFSAVVIARAYAQDPRFIAISVVLVVLLTLVLETFVLIRARIPSVDPT